MWNILLHCRKYKEEFIHLIEEAWKWNIYSILRTSGELIKDTQRAVMQCLNKKHWGGLFKDYLIIFNLLRNWKKRMHLLLGRNSKTNGF